MTCEASQKLGKEIVAAVRSFVQLSLAKRDERLDALEAKQSRTLADAYRGGWGPNNNYARGDVVNHKSAIWLCMQATSESPGSTANWRLILKSPRQ